MMAPLAVAQLPCWHDVWASVRTLGFLTGVACSFVVLLICWLIEFSRRMRRKNKVLRVTQADGGELVLTYKAIRTHVRLLLEREFSALALKAIEINGGASKSMRLHVIAAEGVKLADIRGKVCGRLDRSFKENRCLIRRMMFRRRQLHRRRLRRNSRNWSFRRCRRMSRRWLPRRRSRTAAMKKTTAKSTSDCGARPVVGSL